MTMITIDTMVARWSDPGARPLFKGSLIDDTGCCCPQGDTLRAAGWSDDRLMATSQAEADKAVARELGISVAHSVLLRIVNARGDGCPQDVLARPEKILGIQADLVLAFWWRLDRMTSKDWQKVNAAGAAAWDAAWDAARDAAGAAAGDAASATHEIQGAALMRERGQAFFFLPMFGISDPEELRP